MTKRGQFTLTVGDKEVNGHFSMTFLYSICELKGLELSQIHEAVSNIKDAVGLSEIIFAAHKAHCLRTNQKTLFLNQYDLLDELFENGLVNNQKMLTDVYGALQNSLIFQNDENEGTGLTRKVKKDSKNPK